MWKLIYYGSGITSINENIVIEGVNFNLRLSIKIIEILLDQQLNAVELLLSVGKSNS